MVPTLAADQITLHQLQVSFGLIQTQTPRLTPVWQQALPALTPSDQQRLARIQAAFANLAQRAVLKNIVKLAVVAPLLDLAGVFLSPFCVTTEQTVEFELPDPDGTVRGRMDVLVLVDQLWVLVLESKRAEFAVKVGIPQVLTYMLAAPVRDQPLYGLVTNGSNFVFLQLDRQATQPVYCRSREFVLENPGELAQVLQILQGLALSLSL